MASNDPEIEMVRFDFIQQKIVPWEDMYLLAINSLYSRNYKKEKKKKKKNLLNSAKKI